MQLTRTGLSYLPPVALLITTLSTNWTKPYLCLGPIGIPGVIVGLVVGIAGCAWFFIFGGHRGTSRTVIGLMNFLIISLAISAGIYSIAPCLNAALDFGPETTTMGTIREIHHSYSSRNSRPSRIVTTTVNGRDREVSFNPRRYWDVAAVRNGGPVRLTVRPGMFGIPWIEKLSDP